MKQKTLSLLVHISLLTSMHMFAAEVSPNSQDANPLNEQLYRSLVYVNKDVRESIMALTHLFTEHQWSSTCQNVCLDIKDEATVMPCKDIACAIDECLELCNNFPHDTVGTIQAELEKYKQILDAGKAHISSWKNDEDVDEIITRNRDCSRDFLQLCTRNLTVNGVETVNGLLTVNGIIALNGRLIINGIDINTIITNAAAAAASASGGGSGGSGIQAINGDSGSATGPIVTLSSLNSGNQAGSSVRFDASGSQVVFRTTDANGNTSIGQSSGNVSQTGTNNTTLGLTAGFLLSGGSYNTLLGNSAGINYFGSESSNISLNNLGVPGESNTLRIGAATGTGNQQLNRAFIYGIRGITTGIGDAIPVLIDSASQLGTVSSSKRFKENIVPMPDSFSENILNVNPTLFNYTQDKTKKQTWGLIAEDVQQIFPGLVISDKEGLPFTVKYHELPVLLLNELIKLKKEHVEMKKENVELEKRILRLEKN